MPNKKKASDSIALINRDSTFGFVPHEKNIYEGERLTCLLQSLKTKIESAKLVDGDNLPEKFWFKQQFAIGINEVTRVLERMTSCGVDKVNPAQQPCSSCHRKAPSIQLQAVLLASDCNPRWLTKHIQNLALSRNVPLIFVKDKKAGSLRLGELVKIKTAIAIGVKVKGNLINGLFQKILHGDLVDFGTDSIKLTKMLDDTQCE